MLSLLLILATPNCSYLSDTNVAQQDSIWGSPKQVAALKQNYYDRTRNYDELDTSYTNQLSYYQNFSGHSQSYQDLYIVLRKAQTDPYVQNARRAERNGDVSPEVSYGSAAVSSVSGNPVQTEFSGIRLSQNLNVINGTSDTTIEKDNLKINLNVNSRSARDPATAEANNTELYQTNAQVGPLNLSYRGTTQQTQASFTEPLSEHLVAVLSRSWGGFSPEVNGKLGYGFSF